MEKEKYELYQEPNAFSEELEEFLTNKKQNKMKLKLANQLNTDGIILHDMIAVAKHYSKLYKILEKITEQDAEYLVNKITLTNLKNKTK